MSVDYNQPIIFRTTNESVSQATQKEGSIWMRSFTFYKNIEDLIRLDSHEGDAVSTFGAQFNYKDTIRNNTIKIGIGATFAQVLPPHYIFSMHGLGISETQRQALGGHTFGVRNITLLANEILYHASKLISCTQIVWGPIRYQQTAMTISTNPHQSGHIGLSDDPRRFIGLLDHNPLRKRPIAPFIEQDEWRIALFVDSYLNERVDTPLRINVDPSHFYPYEV